MQGEEIFKEAYHYCRRAAFREKYAFTEAVASDRIPQHISMDSVIAGIESVFPETGIDSGAHTDLRENIRYISSRMAPFLRARIDSGEYDECDYGMVIDTSYDREQVFLADTGFFICPLAISGGRLYNGE